VRVPGGRLVPLEEAPLVLPVGTFVDATRGRVELAFETPRGGEQAGEFYDGTFRIARQDRRTGLVTLALESDDLVCPKGKGARAAQRKGKRRTNRLWGDAKGRWRTKGRYGAATVRGTRWLTADTCTTTTIRVAQGVVDAEDLVRDRTTRLRKGGEYVAPGRPARRARGRR
jgi:hypothetical protein